LIKCLIIIVLALCTGFAQEADTLYRLKYKNSDTMLFGNGVNVRKLDVEFRGYHDSIHIVNKRDIDYIKTPHGYILFEKLTISRLKEEESNKSHRITLIAMGNIFGKYKYTLGDFYTEEKVAIWGAPSFEADFEIFKNNAFQEVIDLKLGFGVEYQLPRGGRGITGKFNFMPFFAVVKLCITKNDDISPALLGRFGWNAFFGDDEFKGGANLKGSKYVSVGLAILFGGYFEVRGMISSNHGYSETGLGRVNVRFDKIDAGIGVVF
jgi:hypothetical protein